MKVTCDREALLTAFQTAAAVVPTRSPKPILQNIKLEVSESGAILLATDLDAFSRFAMQRLFKLPHVKDLQTSFSLGEVKSGAALPLTHLAPSSSR